MSESQSDYQVLHQGRFIRMVRRDGWEYVEHPHIRGIVVMVAVTEDQCLLLVDQYRKPLQARVMELPAGMVGDRPGETDEPFEEAARRELIEETGYAPARLQCLTAGPYSPGRSSDLYTFFRATGLTQVGEGGGDEHEDIIVHKVPLVELESWLEQQSANGWLVDPKIYIGLHFIAKESANRP
jgi:ADP-ribose pyrophosphatase